VAVSRLRRHLPGRGRNYKVLEKGGGSSENQVAIRAHRSAVAVSVAALLVGAVIGASLVRIRNVGTIRAIGVEVYKDQSLTEVLHEISWGTLNPGDTKTFDAYIKNTGNDSQKLVMWTETWNPGAAQNYITLTWNYNNQPIPAGNSIPVKFTLTVDSGISDVVGFSFDVIVQGVT